MVLTSLKCACACYQNQDWDHCPNSEPSFSFGHTSRPSISMGKFERLSSSGFTGIESNSWPLSIKPSASRTALVSISILGDSESSSLESDFSLRLEVLPLWEPVVTEAERFRLCKTMRMTKPMMETTLVATPTPIPAFAPILRS
jgi:hypothetical protein